MLSPVSRFLIGYPGALCGMAFTGGVLAEIDARPVAWSAVVAVLCAVLLALRRRCLSPLETSASLDGVLVRRILVALVFFLLGAARHRATAETSAAPFPTAHSPVTMVGTVVRPPLESAGGARATAGADTSLELACGAWPVALRVIAPAPLSGVRGGDTVRVVGAVALPASDRNPGEIAATRTFTVQVQLRENVQLAPFDGDYWALAVGRMRQRLYDVVSAIYGAQARGYVLSILLGDRRLLAPRLKDALLYTGTYHFLAISGLHLGLLMFVVLRVPLPRRWRLTLRLLFLATFTALTGANPPVLRAATLFVLTLLAAKGCRCPRPLNSLGWTALLLLAWEPGAVADVGFQLSFVAVLALTVIHPRLWAGPSDDAVLARRLREIETGLTRSVAARRAMAWLRDSVRTVRTFLTVSTSAFLGTSPLVLHHFHRVHLLAPLWNLLAYPFTLASLLGGAVSLGLGCVHPALARPVARVVDALVEGLADVLERAGSVPGSTVHLPAPGIASILLSYALLASWVTLRRPTHRAAAGLLLLAAASAAALVPADGPAVWTFDDRHGGASLITPPRSEALLIDVAPSGHASRESESIARAVLATGRRRLRALALAHPGGAGAHTVGMLHARLDVGEVWVPPRFRRDPAGRGTVDQLAHATVHWRTVGRGSRLVSARDGETTIDVLYPQHGDRLLAQADRRDVALVFRLTREGRHVLFAGTLGDPGIARLLALGSGLRADVLVFPRRGAERRLRDELLAVVDPRHVILIGRGGARDRRLAGRIARRGPRVLATWRKGAVVTDWVPGTGWVPRYWAE